MRQGEVINKKEQKEKALSHQEHIGKSQIDCALGAWPEEVSAVLPISELSHWLKRS